jgi:hypothetical protein
MTHRTDTRPPALSYWHLWADDAGVSRHARCELTAFAESVLGPGDSPQWSDTLLRDGNAFLTILPVGWSAGWHINKTAKWIFVLSGSWYVESMDGQRVVIGPGDFSFGGDQGCKPDAQGRLGHLSGQVGDMPCVQLIVRNNDPAAWVNARPGTFS